MQERERERDYLQKITSSGNLAGKRLKKTLAEKPKETFTRKPQREIFPFKSCSVKTKSFRVRKKFELSI